MRSNYAQYLVACCECGRNTSKAYARANGGKCKACAHPETSNQERENALLIDSGYNAYARERGDYDIPDCY